MNVITSWWRICEKKIEGVYSELYRLILPSFSLFLAPVCRLPLWLNKRKIACVAARPFTSPRPR